MKKGIKFVENGILVEKATKPFNVKYQALEKAIANKESKVIKKAISYNFLLMNIFF